jgi:quinol monooxygenase YgiN
MPANVIRPILPVFGLCFFSLAIVACGDDTSGDPGGTTSTTTTTTSSVSAGGSGGAGGEGGAGGMGGAGGAEDQEFAVVVRGILAGNDLQASQMSHDQLAMGGEAAAKAAGDISHDVLLGTTLLGTTENQFLAVDRWESADNLDAFYADPDFQAAFGALFSAPPTLEKFAFQRNWAGWGDDLNAGDASDPHYFVVVRGRLKDVGTAMSQAMHDEVASAGEAPAIAAGDVAHLPYLGKEDPREFLAVDIWSSADNLEAFYSDPAFQMAFAALFEGPPTIGVYASTDWHQW